MIKKQSKFGKKIERNLRTRITDSLKYAYFLLKNTKYTSKYDENTGFIFIFVNFLMTNGFGMILMEYYKREHQQATVLKNEFIKYFDKSNSCIFNLKNNKVDEANILVEFHLKRNENHDLESDKIVIYPDIEILKQGIKECQDKSKKYKGENIIITLITINFINGIYEPQFNHTNTIIINKEKKKVWRVEPDLDEREKTDDIEYDNARKVMEKIYNIPLNNVLKQYFSETEYTYSGYYPFNNRTFPQHGYLCSFLSVLVIYTNVTLTADIIKKRLLQFIEWEYKQFSGKKIKINNTIIKNSILLLIAHLNRENKTIKSMKLNDQETTQEDFENFTKKISTFKLKAEPDLEFNF